VQNRKLREGLLSTVISKSELISGTVLIYMDILFRIGMAVGVLLLPPILAVVTLYQSGNRSETPHTKPARPVLLAAAILINWVLLIVFWVSSQAGVFVRRFVSTRLADVFLLFSLLLLVTSLAASVSVGRWKLCAAAVLLLCFWVGTEQFSALRDNGSMLSVLITRVADKIGFPPGSSAYDTLHKMANYEKRGMYGAAINAGNAWITEHPIDGTNDRVFLAIASIFLQKAKQDSSHADQYVDQALVYRDKAIPIASDTTLGWYSMTTLRDMSLISESAGELSSKQRCVQYRNGVKLLERVLDQLETKRVEISRRTPNTEDQFGVSRDTVEQLSEQTKAGIARLRAKQQNAACE